MSLPLDQLPDQLREKIQARLDYLEFENRLLRQQLRLMRIEKYGKRSEKLSDDQLSLLDGEPSVTKAEVDQEAAQAQQEQQDKKGTQKGRRKPRNQEHPGRVELPQWIERREVVVPCQSQDIYCSCCGEERPVIGYEISEELEIEPVQYYVRVIKREKRGSHCLPEQGVATAATPTKIIPKSKLSNQLIVDVVVKKYFEHLPLYRQCAILEQDAGVELSRQTLDDAVMAVGDLLRPVSRSLKANLFCGGYIQADESPVPCQSREKKGRNHQAYMWEYSRPDGPVVFDFQMDRSRDGPSRFLKGFQGILQCDGYPAYDKLGKDIVYVGCMAHLRRGFEKANRLAPEDPLPLEVLGSIKELYRIEDQARESCLSVAERLALRREKSSPLMQQLKERILEIRQKSLPASQLAKACDYALGQWERVEKFLEDGQVEIDNNWCENAIRPVALGRRNWLHIGSQEAGPKIAAIASVLETCRRLNINIRDYLNDVLPKLPEWPVNRVDELSPLTWKANSRA